MKPCVISINGSNYYAPCDTIDYLTEQDGYLINLTNSTITLYASFPIYNQSNSGYPRITCPSNQTAYIRFSSSAQNQLLTVNSLNVVSRSWSNNVLIYFAILGVLICQFFKH